jgi:stage II sporulation protein D
MKRLSLYFLSVVFLFPACRPVSGPATRAPLEFKGQAAVNGQKNVRIGIRVDALDATISSNVPLVAKEVKSGKLDRWSPGTRHFTVVKGVLRFGSRPLKGAWRLTPSQAGATITVGRNFYRGAILLKATGDDKLTVINELDIDDYLKGVLPREVQPAWAEEALKAQAVASRTYLASHLGRHADQGFDLCSEVHCQVYGGATKEHPKTNQAVDETRGQILVYQGKPAATFFHANCGGATEGEQLVWGTADQPYLRSRRCRWGTGAPWYNWRLTMGDNEIIHGLKAKGLVKGDTLKSISILRKGPSGRASSLAVRTNAGTFTMLANDFRIALNPERVRSTLFTQMTRLKGGYVFAGRGWGHGVGLCQWGAKGMAEEGKEYREILAYFYPGTDLALWSRE